MPLFSDLLLHNMGTLGDRSEPGSARDREMRPAPLWVLRARAPCLHDGRAAKVNEAIRAHDGEAAAWRKRDKAFSASQRKQPLELLAAI